MVSARSDDTAGWQISPAVEKRNYRVTLYLVLHGAPREDAGERYSVGRLEVHAFSAVVTNA